VLFHESDWRNVDAGERVAGLPKLTYRSRAGESRFAPALPDDALQPTARRTNPYSPGSENVLK